MISPKARTIITIPMIRAVVSPAMSRMTPKMLRRVTFWNHFQRFSQTSTI